ncbi:MAG: hypothetical protein ACQEUM_04395 [Pseudomonadota bacterium]
MEGVRQIALSFPTVVFSALLMLVAVYWLMVLLRLAPLQLFEQDSLKGDHLASSLVALGFAGVPPSVALSVLLLLAGAFSAVVEWLLLSPFDLGLFRLPLGVAVLWASLALASPLAALLCRRMHPWFHRRAARNRRVLLGESVEVQAEPDGQGWTTATLVDDPECSVRLHGKPESMPHAGERRVLVKYVSDEDAFRSVAEHDYLDARTRLSRLHLKRR